MGNLLRKLYDPSKAALLNPEVRLIQPAPVWAPADSILAGVRST